MNVGSEQVEQKHHHTHKGCRFHQQEHDNNNKGQNQEKFEEERENRWRKVNFNNRRKELTRLVEMLRTLEPPIEQEWHENLDTILRLLGWAWERCEKHVTDKDKKLMGFLISDHSGRDWKHSHKRLHGTYQVLSKYVDFNHSLASTNTIFVSDEVPEDFEKHIYSKFIIFFACRDIF